jgi:autotransporter-associated beta strand protein
MIFRTRSRGVIAFAGAVIVANVRAPADVVWTGLGTNSNWTTPTNWQGGVAPLNDGSEQIYFGSAQRTAVIVNPSQSVRRLRFDFSAATNPVYSLSGLATTLTLGGDGIELISGSGLASTAGAVAFESSLGLALGTAQTWSVDPNTTLKVFGTLSGTGPLTLTGGGYVALAGNNTYTGGTVLEEGTLGIEHDNALGSGALTITGPAALSSNSGARILANALNLNSTLLDLLPYGGEFRLNGAVTLGASTTVRNYGQPVYLAGPIGETGGARSLTFSGPGAVVLSGTNTYSGGTAVTAGGLFFSNAGAIPAAGALSTSLQGYIGIGFNTGVQSGFIAKFSTANTSGTIGFDSDPGASSATLYTEPVDVSAFNAFARLGSATRATFSSAAVITPAILGGYRFGGGGGTLRLESKLTGLHSLTVDSSATRTPLTLQVANTTNDYSGVTSVTHSALVFGVGALSSGSANGSFLLGNGGYIGSADPAVTLSTWLAKFSTATLTGVVGFDSANVSSPRTITGIFDLSPFVTATSLALGTTSAATLSGSITLPPLQTSYYLTGYKGGWLTVDAVLTGGRGLRIGGSAGEYPEFDPNDLTRMSTVFLNGSNSHTGGTTLLSGRLVVGDANALGTGAVTVDGSGATVYPRLETLLATNPTFPNQLIVQDDFEIGGVNPFTWAGNIVNGTSTGTIRKHGAFNLTLSGTNSGFSGGFLINDGTITFASDSAAGTGALDLGFSSGTAAFTTAAPVITSLLSQSTTARVTVATGTTLTINQGSDATFRGQIQGAGGIVKTGTGSLRLESAGTFTGGTAITAGTVEVASTGALGSSTVTLNGTTSILKLSPGVTLANSIAFGSSGGRLAGHGTFSSAVVIGANTVLAPGSSVGTLTFTSGLTLAGGGSYDFEMQNATGGPGVGWDFAQVTGQLTFTATPTSPFTLNLLSLNSSGARGNPENFFSSSAYSWSIASATSFSGFNPAAVTINTSNFTPGLNGGLFTLSTSGTNLLLNFTPVPEPSTWALLLAGLGLVGFRKLRRRR